MRINREGALLNDCSLDLYKYNTHIDIWNSKHRKQTKLTYYWQFQDRWQQLNYLI